MVIKVYVSRCSGNIEMKMKQDFIVRILESRRIDFEQVDISDPQQDEEKAFMREHSTAKDGQRVPLPPQIFSDKHYCGDYDAFLDANEDDIVYEFLKLEGPRKKVSVAEIQFTELPEETWTKDGEYEEDAFDIDTDKENLTLSTEKKEESRDVITEAVEKQDSEKDNRNISIGEYRNTSDADTTKDSSASGDRKISVLSVESLERGGEREDSGSLHDYENVVLTQDGDGNTVVAVKAEVDSGSLHDYENVVLTTDGEGNTVVQVKDEVTSEEGGKVESVNGENGAGAATEVTSGCD